MSVAFRAPRAPIERPKPPSSRFSFYRRILPRRVNLRNLIAYRKELLNNLGDASLIIRPYKNYIKGSKSYLVRESLEKYIEYIRSRRDYDLAISLSTLRRIYNKRLRIRKEVRKARIKLAE